MDIYHPSNFPRYFSSKSGITALERGIRLSQAVSNQSSFSDSDIWNNGFYTFTYYLRYLYLNLGIYAILFFMDSY